MSDYTLVVKKVKGNWQAEIRRTFPRNGAQVLVIVGLDGYNYGSHDLIECPKNHYNPQFFRPTKGYNIRFSSNQALDFTWDEWLELDDFIASGVKALLEIEDASTNRS